MLFITIVIAFHIYRFNHCFSFNDVIYLIKIVFKNLLSQLESFVGPFIFDALFNLRELLTCNLNEKSCFVKRNDHYEVFLYEDTRR